MNAQDVLSVMKQKNITELYHANTVLTSLSFLTAGGLLSRGATIEHNLLQTSQTSDNLDQEYNIWYDIFLDSSDYHERTKRINFYGPVCFIFDRNVLTWPDLPNIKITTVNPVNWSSIPESERYLLDASDYKKGDIGQHLTLVNAHRPLPFQPYLKKIVIDNPELADNNLFNRAYQAISEKLNCMGLLDLLEVRNCSNDCQCKQKYKEYNPSALWYKYRVQ